jgi:hypothetical protein
MNLPSISFRVPVLACGVALAGACADDRRQSTGAPWFPPSTTGDDGEEGGSDDGEATGSDAGNDGEATGEDDGNGDSGDGGDPMPDIGDDEGATGDDDGDPGEPPEGRYPSELPLVPTGLEVPGNVDLGLATNPQTKRNPRWDI